MPKYIKDGAYTIVVDERSVSPKRTASPKADDDESASEDEFGNFRESRDEFQVEEDEWARDDEEEEQEENIDYADPSFILQNLKLATPDFSQDKTFLLPCREDLSKIICSQVRFYCFCALDAFLRNPKAVSILIIGEGFIGARIINDLISNGCKDALRVCTRGDLTAEEWRARGVKADNDLPALLNGEQPDIVIITVENASFTTICRQLTANYVLSASSFIISCSFGFQRRKLHAQLHTPNIFRSFVEPEQIYSKYKKNAFSSILAFTKTEVSNMMTDSLSIQTANSFKAIPTSDAVTLPEGVTAEEYNGASCICKRSLDVRNIVYQLENFYAIQHHGFSEARNKALKNVFGVYIDAHGVETGKPSSPGRAENSSQATGSRKGGAPFAPPTDESYEAMSIRKAMKTEAKLRSRLESMIRKLGEFNACSFSYQTQFRSAISEEDLQVLKAQQYTREENNPKSGPNMGYQKYKHNAKEGADGPARKTIADLPGRSMYDADFIEAIFHNDEDYSSFTGPGFDLMTSWDTKPTKKTGSSLNQLHALTGTASSDSSVVSGTFKGSRAHGRTPPPHHVYRSPAQSVAPLTHTHSNVHGQHGHIHAGSESGSAGVGASVGHGAQGRPAHSVRASRMQEPLSEEAAQELAEFGRRLSHYADHEGTKIDQNYMQKYLEVSSNNLG